MYYRKKPIIIQAMQHDGTPERANEIRVWSGGKLEDHWVNGRGDETAFNIKTLEGTMKASKGDWIIKGVQGEFYPCKPDIFEATYEKVEEMSPP